MPRNQFEDWQYASDSEEYDLMPLWLAGDKYTEEQIKDFNEKQEEQERKEKENRKLVRHRFDKRNIKSGEDALGKNIQSNNIEALKQQLAQLEPEEINLISTSNEYEEGYLGYFDSVSSSLEMLQLFSHYGIDICRPLKFDPNLLHPAARMKDEKIIKFLIEQGIDVNAETVNDNYRVVLRLMMEKKNITAVKLLLKAGANVYGDELSQPKWKALEFKFGNEEVTNSPLPSVEEIKNLLENENIAFVNIGTKENPVYRMADEKGLAYQTYQEKYKTSFKKKVNELVAFSLFNQAPQGIANGMYAGGLAEYLDLNAINQCSQVSAVRDENTLFNNHTTLKNAHDTAIADAKITMKKRCLSIGSDNPLGSSL